MSDLSIKHVGKRFGSAVALADISLHIKSGEFICLLGASGCGKTTLLRIIAGLERCDQGELQLADVPLSDLPCHKRNIGMVFQSLALFPHLNVSRNVAYGLKMRNAPEELTSQRVTELLALTGLEGFETRSVASLSGGQRQRVAIARALALEPQLFLMDEPFSALDAALREHLQAEVKKLQRELGVTTIFVTHDQSEAMSLADRIVVLNNGVVEQCGSPREIYQRPRSAFVANFIGSNNLLDIHIDDDSVKFNGLDLGPPKGCVEKLRGAHTLTMRPEALTLHDTVRPDSYLSGAIVMIRTVGALVEVDIDVGGQLFKQTMIQNDVPDIAVGDAVGLSWDWSTVWCIPGEH